MPQVQEEAKKVDVAAYLQKTQASRNLLLRSNEARLKNDQSKNLLPEQRQRRVSYDRITGRPKNIID